ncbi:MAG TPA: dihydropteroate synthase [Crenotrichaceae bacterium]|nr:dihydropteroate synthase [Crenotrichaceae bacterium]
MTYKKQFQQNIQSGKPLIMGILNLTPDSFSDGGQFNTPQHALERALQMAEQGANIIDVGGESTRPGSVRVMPEQQIDRVIPVIEAVRSQLPDRCCISIDTTSSNVARAALQAGASIINDISAGSEDPKILQLAAQTHASISLMHMQGTPGTMQDNPHYNNVVEEILEYLQQRITVALDAGIAPEQIIIDPGIGFGKRRVDNLQLLASLDQFSALGYPVLLGTSRKRFMGAMLENPSQQQLALSTAMTTALGVMSGVRIFRVHDVEENRIAADLAYTIRQSKDTMV